MKDKKENFPDFTFKNADGVKYRVVWKAPARSFKASGLCDSPNNKDPEVWVNPKLEEIRLLEVLIEEFFHAFNYKETEKVARKFAYNLAKIIRKSGWKNKRF